MLIYNVTIKVETAIAAEWLQWLQKEHVPLVLNTGCFTDASIHRLLEVDDTDGPTYTIQYKAADRTLYNLYIEKHATEMRRQSFDKWGSRFIAFRSLMQVVN